MNQNAEHRGLRTSADPSLFKIYLSFGGVDKKLKYN